VWPADPGPGSTGEAPPAVVPSVAPFTVSDVRQPPSGQLSVAPRPAQLGPEASLSAAGQPVTPSERPSWATVVSLAVLTGIAAVALGGWALVAADDGPPPLPSTRSVALERAVSVLADPKLARIPLTGSVGRIVLLVGARGDAVLMLNGLVGAAPGRSYQTWITIPGSGEMLPAGLFDGSEPFVIVGHRVMPGARVSVTVEDEGGAAVPSRTPRLSAVRA
jgi:anti-sigma-K factor RskA